MKLTARILFAILFAYSSVGLAIPVRDRTHIEAPETQKIQIWNESKKAVETIDGVEFKRLTGAHFVSEIKVQPEFLKKARSGKFASSRDIPACEIMAEYEGMWRGSLDSSRAEYSTPNIDATDYRGYSAFAADGAPNAKLLTVGIVGGINRAEILVAIRPIAAHEAIFVDYGRHDVKWSVYKELASESIDAFINSFNLQTYAERSIRGASVSKRHAAKFLFESSMVEYISNTPIVLWRLLIQNKLSRENFKRLTRLDSIVSDGGSPLAQVAELTEEFLESIDAFDDSRSGWRKKLVLQFLEEKLAEGNVQIIVQFLQRLPLRADFIAKEKKAGVIAKILEALWLEGWQFYCDAPEAPKNYNRGRCGEVRLPR